jgi:hypothetical protein
MDVRLAAMILIGAIVGRAETAETNQVDVYIQSGNWTQPLRSSELIASEIFARSDVRVIWHTGELPDAPPIGRRCIGIRMVEHAPILLGRGALASARPYGSSGSLISVYADRVQQLLDRLPSLSNGLLAYIFAHELAHVMLGYNYHSASGILKAQWSSADYAAMRARRLDFTEDDWDRIRNGLAQ